MDNYWPSSDIKYRPQASNDTPAALASARINSSNVTKPSRNIKCVLVGDGAVGKTSLIVSYTTNGYPQEYVPTAFDTYTVSVCVDGQPIRLQLCDTAGQGEFDALRPLSYPNTDVFILCFSVVVPASFNNLQRFWIHEIRKISPDTPCLIVGTQCDLRTDIGILMHLSKRDQTPIDPALAQSVAQRVGAMDYIECSALTQQNLKEVFDAAILCGLNTRKGPEASNDSEEPGTRRSLRLLKEKLQASVSRSSQKDSKMTNAAVAHSLPSRTTSASQSPPSHMNSFNHPQKHIRSYSSSNMHDISAKSTNHRRSQRKLSAQEDSSMTSSTTNQLPALAIRKRCKKLLCMT